jgi:hypothetical protein
MIETKPDLNNTLLTDPSRSSCRGSDAWLSSLGREGGRTELASILPVLLWGSKGEEGLGVRKERPIATLVQSLRAAELVRSSRFAGFVPLAGQALAQRVASLVQSVLSLRSFFRCARSVYAELVRVSGARDRSSDSRILAAAFSLRRREASRDLPCCTLRPESSAIPQRTMDHGQLTSSSMLYACFSSLLPSHPLHRAPWTLAKVGTVQPDDFKHFRHLVQKAVPTRGTQCARRA